MAVVTTLPASTGFVRADLDAMPDDGRRYELIDGSIIVTPSPSMRHQYASGRLHLLLSAACPADLIVLFAPFDVALDDTSVLQPDLLVARSADFTEQDLPLAPLLAVEVLSPSTRRIDLTLKRSRYEAAGTVSYWGRRPGRAVAHRVGAVRRRVCRAGPGHGPGDRDPGPAVRADTATDGLAAPEALTGSRLRAATAQAGLP